MPNYEILVKKFRDYTPTVIDDGKEVNNLYYPNYSHFAADEPNSLPNPKAIVIHQMAARANEHANGQVSSEALSTDPYDCKNVLESLGVSAHFLIPEKEVIEDENGDTKIVVYQMVQENRKAWHAGVSRLPNLREGEKVVGLNHTSIGIELLRHPDEDFTDEQYIAVVGLIAQLFAQGYPIEDILGHDEVAGDDVRGDGLGKTDPKNFDWPRFLSMLADALNVPAEAVKKYRSRVVGVK